MTSAATSAALNFVGGIPFQLLYDSVKMALDRTRKFRSHLTKLQFTLDCLKPRIIEQIGENNFELNLPNDIVQDLKTKMNEGKVLMDRLLELSMWNIHVWGNCYNCLGPNCGQQLDELDRSLRILLEQLEMEQRRNVTELLILARNTKDKQEELEKRQLDILRGQQEMFDLMMKQQNAIGKIVSNSVQQVAWSNGGGGADPALGLVFGVLFDAVIKVKVKNVMFKRLLRKFKSTLYCSQPLIEEISTCNKVLHLPKEEVEYFVMEIKNGVELVHKFSEVHKRANYNKCTYTSRILNLDESLQRLLIELNGQVKRNVKEAMNSANEIEAVIKKIEGGGWAQNNEFGSELPPLGSPTIGLDVLNMKQGPRDVNKVTLADSARITEEGVKPIEASDAVQNQMEIQGSCEMPPPPAVGLDVLNMQGPSDVIEEKLLDLARVKQEMIKPNEVETLDSTTRNIEVGVMETEGTEVVVSTRDVPETMEIAIAGTEPPSPTVGLDVHGTRDVKVTLDMPMNVLKQIECESEIATAEPLSSSPAVGLTLDPASNTKTGLKQPEEEKEAVLEHLKWSTTASMTSFKRKHSETETMMQATPFPEECTANIISLTTPADVCRLSLVSRSFKLAAECDEIWEKFLPPDIHRILSQSTFASTSAAKAKSKSKKEFYLALCDNPILIDNGKKSFSLDKWSGKKCYTICARALHIVWSEEKYRYWKWISVPESRFEEVACLEDVCWLEIRGRIDTRMLSPSTLYKAYLVYKLANAYNLDVPVEVTTRTRHYGFEYENLDHWFREYEDKQRGYLDPERQINGAQSPIERLDGWLELELGEFLCRGEEEEDGELEMICVEMHDLRWKRGLIVQGIEVRPATKKGKAITHLRAKGKNALTII